MPSLQGHWNGSQFESEYLTPVAKTDLLYDNVYFNTTVLSVGRLNHTRSELHDMQARCNDEFYLTVHSRDRNTYIARADIVVDCRNTSGKLRGLGPGGVTSIGQSDCTEQFLQFFPQDDRFEHRVYDGKKILISDVSPDSIRFVSEFLQTTWSPSTSLLWLVRYQDQPAAESLLQSHFKNEAATQTLVSLKSCLGVVSLQRKDASIQAKVLHDDDSTVEDTFDFVVAPIDHGYDDSIVRDALYVETSPSGSRGHIPASDDPDLAFTTTEPHYYVMQPIEYWHDSQGLSPAHRQIRQLYALLGGRPDLDLYQVIQSQIES